MSRYEVAVMRRREEYGDRSYAEIMAEVDRRFGEEEDEEEDEEEEEEDDQGVAADVAQQGTNV